jgi:SAM-dependent methyltransferase
VGSEAGGIFTGERLVAGDPLFAADFARHLVAYRFAQEQVRGQRVLDAGCGDGYGTDLLAETARRALGVDRSARTIETAARRYRRPNLAYRVCELPRLAELGERFDVVCNFQVIEHLADPVPFVRQAREVLEPGGRLIVTTPNRLQSVVENPYHVHEYVAEELRELLLREFARVEVRGVCGDEKAMAYDRQRIAQAQRILRLDPLNLRRWVPLRLIETVYPLLARLVRKGVARADGEALQVGPENFAITADCDAALDLLAICRRD